MRFTLDEEMKSFVILLFSLLVTKNILVSGNTCELGTESKPKKIEIGDKTSFILSLSGLRQQKQDSVVIKVDTEKRKVATTSNNVTLTTKKSSAYVDVCGQDAGETYVIFNTTASVNVSNLHSFKVKVHVVHSNSLVILNMVIGWIYFVAWSVSFYPQVKHTK